ncbi:MAG TPA: glycosyltransferase family 1 protein [Gemmatimonas aurantiaca]|uniref:Glycosyltransferase n=2 Tax=Gemmatimonas aurantiaca TaxID=173480 RepID=C1A665_GEMAT|nr:glycosyltransferase family 1 protein [Gemmatimonas aurantiaca]BAH37725.1 glycosyltransferase [Gemmatimonas aurantiaca T-27]HCT58760.1 glycosyltransferase family 1 protein [Gemmatimonas aurantiaca]
MRLLVCTDTYPPLINGVSVVTALTVEGLRRRGWECLVVMPGMDARGIPHPPSDREVERLPAVSWHAYPDVRAALWQRHRVRALINEFHPDVVHCATEFVVGWYGRQEARRAGVPYTTSYHTDFSRYTASWGVPWLRRPVQSWIRYFHRHAARVFTPSVSARNDLRALGLRELEVWGRGVDVNLFRPRAGLDTTCADERPFRFLYVGRLAPEKNIELLIDAMALTQARHPDRAMVLDIVGDGPSREALTERAARQSTVTIRFLGAQDRQCALPRIYAEADAFVYASATETLGLVVLEAMAAGLPVIATPAGGIAEHLRDDINGLAYPTGDCGRCADAMSRMLTDALARVRLAKGARATAEQRSWDSELQRLDVSYREVLARSRESHGI